jgi:hypothetical protein
MDILKFLSQGNVSANPDYNPKTKKGALEPPTLVNFNKYILFFQVVLIKRFAG